MFIIEKMERYITTPGVILRTRRFKEKHKSLTILTDQFGIIEAIQYGVATGKSLGIGDQFTSGIFHLYHNPVRETWKVEEVSDVEFIDHITEDIYLLYTASFCAEVLLKTHIGGGEFSQMRVLFLETLRLFQRGYPRDIVLIRFMWRFLHYTGLIDGITRCVECESVIGDGNSMFLDEQIPGLVCEDCGHPSMVELSPSGRVFLVSMEQYSWSYLQDNPQVAPQVAEAKRILLRVIEIVAEGRLQTLSSGLI